MRSRWLLLATGLYAVAIAAIGLWKTPVDRGVPVAELAPVRWMADLLDLYPWQAYDVVESVANVVLFVPLGVLTLLWRPRWNLLHAIGLALATTVAIETLQQVLRPERFASLDDVMANTLGGAIGGLLVVVGRLVAQSPASAGPAGRAASDSDPIGDDRAE